MAQVTAILAAIFLLSGLAAAWSDGPDCYIECSDVFAEFVPCVDFVSGLANEPPNLCCEGVIVLNKMAKQGLKPTERICYCIERIANQQNPPLFRFSQIHALPQKCNTYLSFPISVAMDCFKIKFLG